MSRSVTIATSQLIAEPGLVDEGVAGALQRLYGVISLPLHCGRRVSLAARGRCPVCNFHGASAGQQDINIIVTHSI